MNFRDQIAAFIPANPQERRDQAVILDYIGSFPDDVLLRDNPFAHVTSSGFVMNRDLDRVLLVHHNLRGVWSWTGGHADGDSDLLRVALKEATEETGVHDLTPLSPKIASLDILPVYGHLRQGEYVNAHLHLSVAYILIGGAMEPLTVNEAENSAVAWFGLDRFTGDHFDAHDVYLYNKLIQRAKQIGRGGERAMI